MRVCYSPLHLNRLTGSVTVEALSARRRLLFYFVPHNHLVQLLSVMELLYIIRDGDEVSDGIGPIQLIAINYMF